MTLHHPMELAVAGVVCVGKMLGSILGEMVGDIIAEGILDLVKAPFRRGKRTREPTNPEREAEDRRPKLWAEVLAEARSHPPNRSEPAPHALKLPEAPTPPRADWPRSPAGPGDGACPPPRRSTGG